MYLGDFQGNIWATFEVVKSCPDSRVASGIATDYYLFLTTVRVSYAVRASEKVASGGWAMVLQGTAVSSTIYN